MSEDEREAGEEGGGELHSAPVRKQDNDEVWTKEARRSSLESGEASGMCAVGHLLSFPFQQGFYTQALEAADTESARVELKARFLLATHLLCLFGNRTS